MTDVIREFLMLHQGLDMTMFEAAAERTTNAMLHKLCNAQAPGPLPDA